ncbi:glycoside hydrolase N-terminal domain-containing protein [Pedobacter sp. HDW13]|uniref:glycoside hydrolase family 95 protein n=1 Tax=Pedobacter sp. HDW13 TaxID=2714940 RepID=UPI001980FA98|nr:glycoside hydrolase family 95 protein [Pedobacter sp. HDW13]
MFNSFKTYICLFLLFISSACFAQQQDLKLWYTQPAEKFVDALPLGNGSLGAMVYGGTQTERLSLNESTLWGGAPVDPNMNPNAKNYLGLIREALFQENYKKADSLMRFMQGSYSESYAPLGNLFLDFKNIKDVSAYRRELDIQNAIAKTVFTSDETVYTREVFASHPNRLIVIRITAKGKNKLDFACRFNSLLKAKSLVSNQVLSLNGRSLSHKEKDFRSHLPSTIVFDDENTMRFTALLKVLKTDGMQKTGDTSLIISNATEAVLLLSIATSYNGPDKNPATDGKDEKAIAQTYLTKAQQQTYTGILLQHTKDFRKYFNRVKLNLGYSGAGNLNTAARLNKFTVDKSDNGLIALYYQYSRYLLLSSSRPGGVPNNLQGIWNEAIRPPWASNYTTNINLQMNYWGAETGNLPEMHQPLFDFIASLAKTGTVTAKNYYNASGWVAHHNSDIWAMSNPVGAFGKGIPIWSTWSMGGNWLSTHLWEHYAFTHDKIYLEKLAYPLMKGAVQFCMDFLVSDNNGNLVTAPTISPENIYVTDKGYKGQTLYGATADLAIIRELFADFLQAATILNKDTAMQLSVKIALAKLYAYQIGKGVICRNGITTGKMKNLPIAMFRIYLLHTLVVV